MGKNKNKNKKKGPPVVNIGPKASNVKIEELQETVKNRSMKLRFSPTAWAKFLFMRDIGDTEVGGFAVTKPNDLLYIQDFILPKQECGYASVDFDNESVADFVDDMIDEGRKPEQFLRIWIHTHPNMSASPSKTDENTFERVFGKCNWAIMAIISSNGSSYCRLQVNGGPLPGSFQIPIEVDYKSYDFPASDSDLWNKEYNDRVEKTVYAYGGYTGYGWDDNWDYPGHGRGYTKYSSYGGAQATPVGFTKSDEDEDNDGLQVINGWDESDFDIVPIKVPLSISEDLLQRITPNQMSLLESMSPYEREYVLAELKERLKIGD